MSRLNPKIYRGQCATGCGKSIFSKSCKAKYCSLACSHERYAAMHPIEIQVPCLNGCGNAFAGRKKYSFSTCKKEYKFKIRCPELEAGRYRVVSSNKLIRRYLVSKFG